MQVKRIVAAALLMLSSAAGATALSADQILEKVRNRADGADILAEAQLVLKESNGGSRTRTLLFLEKDYGKDEKLTLAFTGPADVKGVVLQSVNYDEAAAKEDDQWMYLPAFRQVRRIAATDKRGSFMGSQFSYIDLDKLRVGDYRQKLVGEETIDGKPCYMIERTPASESVINRTGYHKNMVWVDKETFVILKQSYFDARGVQFKYFLAKKVEKIQDIWTVTHSEMQDVVNQRSSALIFNKVRYNAGLDDAVFQQNIMKTGVNSGNLPAIR
uniref:Outer membrane lipoprotein-sorting protein n=1 Tax=uncultured bacterium pEAF66 TaxID=480414 RepID=B0LFU6_9BACT|nr:outer membrane lipoprotein-sorting protein [uncultured bacterium pEAF66]